MRREERKFFLRTSHGKEIEIFVYGCHKKLNIVRIFHMIEKIKNMHKISRRHTKVYKISRRHPKGFWLSCE